MISRYLKVFAFTLISLILMSVFVIGISEANGPSMMPTVNDSEIIISLKVGMIKRNDIVSVYLKEEDKHLLKRAVAVPGDRVEIKDGELYINGRLDNSFKSKEKYFLWDGTDISLSDDEYYVLGDNRDNSMDSRHYGTIRRDEIIGKVLFHFY